jgi:hypothetical protein
MLACGPDQVNRIATAKPSASPCLRAALPARHNIERSGGERGRAFGAKQDHPMIAMLRKFQAMPLMNAIR